MGVVLDKAFSQLFTAAPIAASPLMQNKMERFRKKIECLYTLATILKRKFCIAYTWSAAAATLKVGDSRVL